MLSSSIRLARLEIREGAVAVTGNQSAISQVARFLPPVFVLVAILLILKEARHGIISFADLIKAAWTDEWRGRERVAKCNRGGTIISFTVTVSIFLIQQAHSLISGQEVRSSLVIWMFIACMGFLLASLFVLASLEKQKLVHVRRRAKPGRRH